MIMRHLTSTAALLALLLAATTVSANMPTPSGKYAPVWKALGKTDYVAVGADKPKSIVYEFIDPNCTYCHKLWAMTQPYFDQGLQVRYVLVGVISKTSPRKAAAILEAKDPVAAFRDSENRYGQTPAGGGAIEPLAHPAPETLQKIVTHAEMMRGLGFHGTPVLIFMDPDGQLHGAAGLPPAERLDAIFGVRRPGPVKKAAAAD